MKKKVLSCFLAVVMLFGFVGCKNKDVNTDSNTDTNTNTNTDSNKDTADSFTEEHTLFNVTYYVPKSNKDVKRTINGLNYTTEWGKISLITENSKSWDDKSVIDEMKKKSTRKNFETVTVDGEPALYYEYEKAGDKGIVVHFNTNRSGCGVDISSNESVEQAKAQYKEFISKVKIDNKKDIAIDYTQKQAVDNITYYLPENSTKSKDSKDDGEKYYVDGGMISITKMEYIDPSKLHNDNYIQSIKSALDEDGFSGMEVEKKTINNKPVLCIKTEYKEDDKENTHYPFLIYVCSNKNLVCFTIFNYSRKDSELKYTEFLEKLSIDNTKETQATEKTTKSSDDSKSTGTQSNQVIYLDQNVIVSFVEFDSVGKYSGPRIKLFVSNPGRKSRLIQVRDLSVNGYMASGICSFTVTPGNKAYDYITITKSSLEKNNMSVGDISKIEFKLCIADDDNWSDNYETKKITINL